MMRAFFFFIKKITRIRDESKISEANLTKE